MDHICHRLERGERLLDECRFAPSDESVEGIARVSRSSMADDRAGHMGPSHGPARGLLEDAFERHIDAQAVKTANHFLGSADPVGAAALQEAIQVLRPGRQVIAEHMHFAPRGGDGELTSGDNPHSITISRRERLGQAGQRVVIGERNRLQICGSGPLNDSRGRHSPIGRGRMNVEVDQVLARVVRGQRWYPISGAVHEG